jgi:quercetin dioxygenase-like cupin family protein
LEQIPRVATESGDEPDWHPLQHYFGLSAFGANVFVAREPGQTLVEAHDETASGQEELYLVAAGEAAFTLDGEHFVAPALSAVVARPEVTRSAVATAAGTALFVVGAVPRADFASTWDPAHFEDVPRA